MVLFSSLYLFVFLPPFPDEIGFVPMPIHADLTECLSCSFLIGAPPLGDYPDRKVNPKLKPWTLRWVCPTLWLEFEHIDNLE